MLDVPPQDLRPIPRVEYEELARAGSFEDERVELLYGAIVRISPTGPAHDGTIQRLTQLLLLALHPRAAVRIQNAFAASDRSEPQLDVAVVPPGDYLDAHPSVGWLIVEVADSSRRTDRGVKARLYAECAVPEYWVVDLASNLIEVHTEIVAGEYTRVEPYRRGERIALVQFPDVTIAAGDILR
jgi:Uma2 family endonuclease